MNSNPMHMMAGAAVNALRKTMPEASMAPPAAGPNAMFRMMQGRQGKNAQQPPMPMMGGGVPNGMGMQRPVMGARSAKSAALRAPNVGRFDVSNI